MKLRELLNYIGEREELQAILELWAIVLFCVLVFVSIEYSEGSDERQDEEMSKIASECKSAAMEYNFVTSHVLA